MKQRISIERDGTFVSGTNWLVECNARNKWRASCEAGPEMVLTEIAETYQRTGQGIYILLVCCTALRSGWVKWRARGKQTMATWLVP